MKLPVISRRREAARKSIESQAMSKALVAIDQSLVESGTIEKSFLTGNAATLMSRGQTPGSPNKHPGTSWSNQTSLSNKLIQRVTQNLSAGFNQAPEELELALAEQGLSWGPPFPPGRPLDPFFGYRRPPRTMDFPVGSNTQLTPRWNRTSFATIKSIYEAYDVAQICVRHLINDVRSLDFNWEPIPGIKADVSEDIVQAIEFFDSPDKRQPFRTWLAEFLQDVLRYDAGALYVRRNEAGDPIALEVVDGTTLIPLIDFYGRRPEDEDDENLTSEGLFGGEIVPAFVQIIEGLPWDWLAADDLLYQPWNPMPESQYGLAPLEAVLLSANTDIRFQWHFLQFFTEGTVPAGFMEAPPDMSDPAQIQSWQETWDAVMQGDQTKKQQVRWVPSGAKFTELKPTASKFDEKFPLYLARRTMASFGVTPNDLGFTEDVNRATGDTQVDVQFRVGTSPLLRYCEDVINLFVKQHLKLRCRIRFDDGKETEDRVATAQADGIYLDHGVIGIDEVRQELGKPIDKSKPSPRYINNSRAGPIPLIALESMAGKVDADTYGVADGQELVDTPYIPPPGVIVSSSTPEGKAALEASAREAEILRGKTPDTGPTVVPEGDASPEDAEGAAAEAEEKTPIEKMLDLFDELEKTDGITAGTGIQGVDLSGKVTSQVPGLDDVDDDDEDEKDAVKVALSLRRWRENSRNRLKKGRAPKRFVDPDLPAEVHAEIWSKLARAGTRAEVDAAFAGLGKKAPAGQAGTPGFHRNTEAIVDYYAPLLAKAYGKLWSKAAITRAIRAAAASKSVEWEVVPQAEGDGVELVGKEARPERASAALLREQASQAALQGVVVHLQGDASLQGAMEAAVASGGNVADSLQCVVNQLPSDYWDKWQPGFGRAASEDLAALRGEAGIDIQGLTDTAIERVDAAITDGLANGDSFQSIAAGIEDDLGSLGRAEMVANTEYARGMTQASMDTYKESGVKEKEFLAEGDACPECEENADSSPLPIDEEWPNGDVPVHPNCRCAIAPVVSEDGSEPSAEDEAEAEKALPGEGDVVAGLYSDKSCSVVKTDLPPGAEGKPAETAKVVDLASQGIFKNPVDEESIARDFTAETTRLKTVSTNDLIPTQTFLRPDSLEHAKLHPGKHPISAFEDPFSGKYYVQGGHHGAAAAIKAGKTEVPVKITGSFSSPGAETARVETHGLAVPPHKPQAHL